MPIKALQIYKKIPEISGRIHNKGKVIWKGKNSRDSGGNKSSGGEKIPEI